MSTSTAVETRHDRTALVKEAGLSTISISSVLAGMTTAFGAFVIVSALAGGILAIAGVDPDRLANDWRTAGIGGAVFLGITLFIGYLFGGYVTGRMARRAGVRHGLLMVLVSLLVAGGLGVLIGLGADTGRFVDDIRALGVPTSWDEWSAIASIGGAASLAGMLIGAVIGGAWGERWHGELLSRAGRLPATIDLRDEDHRYDRVVDERQERTDQTERMSTDGRDDHDTDGSGKGVDLGDGQLHTHADGTMHAHDMADHDTQGDASTVIGERAGDRSGRSGR